MLTIPPLKPRHYTPTRRACPSTIPSPLNTSSLSLSTLPYISQRQGGHNPIPAAMPPKSKTPQKQPPPSTAPAATPSAGAETSDPTRHLLVDDLGADPASTTIDKTSNGKESSHAGSDWTAQIHNANLAYPLPYGISPETINNTESLLRFVILALISGAAVASRLFAVIRFESVIHEL